MLLASNGAQRRAAQSSGVAQPASSSGVAQPARDDEAMLNFTSLREVVAWLETLPNVEENAELRMIQEAVQVLQKPTAPPIFPICAAWRQAKQRQGQNLTVDVLVAELTEKVLVASNGAQRRAAQSSGAAQPASSSGAAQPAHDDDAMLNFTSLSKVGAWFETLPDVGGDVQLRMI